MTNHETALVASAETLLLSASSRQGASRWPTVPAWLPRPISSHKGTLGTVLILAGSQGMAGAAILSGRGALHSGAGLVRVAIPSSLKTIVALGASSYMTVPLQEDSEGRARLGALFTLRHHLSQATSFAMGPGLGRSLGVTHLVARLQTECALPAVVDADALNALAQTPEALHRPAGPRVLTPHLGELARLLGLPQVTREFVAGQAKELARKWKCVLVVKGSGTLIADAARLEVNETGNPGLATGGTGDVLAGVIAGLLAQGLSSWDSARLGVWLHGLAGDLAAKELGETSMTAESVVDRLAPAFRAFAAASQQQGQES